MTQLAYIYDRDLRDAGGCLMANARRDRPKEVKDMEFVRPSLSVQQRNSEDSLIVLHESPFESRVPFHLVRAIFDPLSSSARLLFPILVTAWKQVPLPFGLSELIEAHRQRELKRVSPMSSLPASLSRKRLRGEEAPCRRHSF